MGVVQKEVVQMRSCVNGDAPFCWVLVWGLKCQPSSVCAGSWTLGFLWSYLVKTQGGFTGRSHVISHPAHLCFVCCTLYSKHCYTVHYKLYSAAVYCTLVWAVYCGIDWKNVRQQCTAVQNSDVVQYSDVYSAVVQWCSTVIQYSDVVQYSDTVQWYSTVMQYINVVQWCSTVVCTVVQYNSSVPQCSNYQLHKWYLILVMVMVLYSGM